MVRQAYGGANLVPIAVPDTCLYMTLSKRKLLFSSINLTDSKMKFFVNRAGIKSFLLSIQ